VSNTNGLNSVMTSAERAPAAIAATSAPDAIEDAASILAEGGSATDAVISTALAQIALSAGSWVSLAGILSFVHFEAATGDVTSLDGGFNTVLNERNPLSIPRFGKPNGRSVLVPGFPAALFAAHSRFGRMSVTRVFAHATAIAEEGFQLDESFSRLLRRRRKAITRLSEGRALFLGSDKRLPHAGERFRQLQLAATLRAAVDAGPDHFYHGDWARRLIEAVRRERGAMTAADLSRYHPDWTDPVKASIGDTAVFAPGFPGLGGMYLAEALHLANAAAFTRTHRSEAERLFWLMQITRARYFASFLEPEQRTDPSVASALWDEIRRRRRFQLIEAMAVVSAWLHSDAVVAIDRSGNVAALCHSNNTYFWGNTGLFVGGVSIPDPASHQQHAILQAGPGRRLPDFMNPAIAIRRSDPVLACSAIGASLHEVTVQSLVEVLVRRKRLDTLSTMPAFLSPEWTGLFRLGALNGRILGRLADLLFATGTRVVLPVHGLARRVLDLPTRVLRGGVSPAVVEKIRRMGQPVAAIQRDPLPTFWVGLSFDSATKEFTGKVRSSAPVNNPAVRIIS
jgi:gamma-glutamyltranspeptidase/glutathione hydrolase